MKRTPSQDWVDEVRSSRKGLGCRILLEGIAS